MKLIGTTFALAALCAIGLSAQTGQVEKSKVEVKEGKDIKVTGCLAPNPAGGYMITDRTGGMEYALATTKDDLAKHVGHEVEVHGKAADMGKAKVKIDSKVSNDEKVGTTGTTVEKEKARGDLALPFMSVKSVKMISKSCR